MAILIPLKLPRIIRGQRKAVEDWRKYQKYCKWERRHGEVSTPLDEYPWWRKVDAEAVVAAIEEIDAKPLIKVF